MIKDILLLTKPKLTALAVTTALLGYWFGSIDLFDAVKMAHLLIGAVLVGVSANSLNQFLERDIDKRMVRTQNRPLPSGRMKSGSVMWFGAATGVIAVLYLIIFTNWLAALLGALIIISYVFAYTPLKRKTELNTFVGAVPGALPILMGWAAVDGTLQPEAWLLFWILFAWQLPHFLAIAWVYKQDYIQSGLRMVSLGDKVGTQTAWQIVFFTVVLVVMSFLPVKWGMAGILYFVAASVTGGLLILLALQQVKTKLRGARRFVAASILYLLFMIIFMVIDKI